MRFGLFDSKYFTSPIEITKMNIFGNLLKKSDNLALLVFSNMTPTAHLY